MIPLGFQDAVGQNFGWLIERAKKEKEREKLWRDEFVILFFEEDRWTWLKKICWLGKNERHCRTILKNDFGKFYWFWYEMLIVISWKYS